MRKIGEFRGVAIFESPDVPEGKVYMVNEQNIKESYYVAKPKVYRPKSVTRFYLELLLWCVITAILFSILRYFLPPS